MLHTKEDVQIDIQPVDIVVCLPKLPMPSPMAILCRIPRDWHSFSLKASGGPLNEQFISVFSIDGLRKTIDKTTAGPVELKDERNDITYRIRRKVVLKILRAIS